MSSKVPPPLKPKPKLPPPIKSKKPDLSNLVASEIENETGLPSPPSLLTKNFELTGVSDASTSNGSGKKFEEEEEQETLNIGSLRGNLRKTNRNWNDLEHKNLEPTASSESDNELETPSEDGQDDNSEKITIIKPKQPSKFTTTPSSVYNQDQPRKVQGVRLPGLANTPSLPPSGTPSRQSGVVSLGENNSSLTDAIRAMPPPPRHASLSPSKNSSVENLKSLNSDGDSKIMPPPRAMPLRSRPTTSSYHNRHQSTDVSEDDNVDYDDDAYTDDDSKSISSYTSSLKAKVKASRFGSPAKKILNTLRNKSSVTSSSNDEPVEDSYTGRLRSGSNASLKRGVPPPYRPKTGGSLTTPQLSDNEDGDYSNAESENEVKPSLPSRPSTAKASVKPSAPQKRIESLTSSIISVESKKDHYESEEEEEEEESDDEDKPALPARPGSSGTPGVKAKSKPVVPKKSKPVIPAKKSVDSTELSPPSPMKKFQPPILKPHSVSAKPNVEQEPEVKMASTPPPPPKPRAAAAAAATTTTITANTPPPPPKPRVKPAAPPPRSSGAPAPSQTNWKPSKLPDLELSTGWFAEEHFEHHLPADLRNLDYATSFGYVSNKSFRILALRNPDLSTTKIKLEWSRNGNPTTSVHHEMTFTPPPTATKKQLVDGADLYGNHVASWSEDKLGKQVGDGECWTLAKEALLKGCGKHAFVTSGLVHGALLVTITGTTGLKPSLSDVRPPQVEKELITDSIKRGDILQFKSCCLRYPNKALFFGSPDHVSIVTQAISGNDSDPLVGIKVAHQNVNGLKVVVEEELDLSKLVDGQIQVYRPVTADWIEELNPMM